MLDACAECDAAIDSLSLLLATKARKAEAIVPLARLTAAVSRSGRAIALAHRRGAVQLVSNWLRADDEAVLEAASAAVSALASQDTRTGRTYTFGAVSLHLVDGSHCEAGLGWRAWRGALVLADILVTVPALVSHRERVLELGAGLGLAGLTAARLGAQSVVLSDSLPALATAQLNNAARNGLATAVSAVHLDWNNDAMTKSLDADVILGSDVIYSLEHAAALPGVLSTHLRRGGYALLVNGVRFPDVLHAFSSALDAHGLDAVVALLPGDAPLNCTISDGHGADDDLEDVSVTLKRVPHLVTLLWHSDHDRPEDTLQLEWMPARRCTFPSFSS